LLTVECLIDENWDRRCSEYFLFAPGHHECQQAENIE